MVAAAAYPATISEAMFGPDSTPAGCPGSTSPTIWVIRWSVPCSSPLTRLTTGIHGRTYGAACSSASRKPCDGTPMISTSASLTTRSMSEVARSPSVSATSPRYRVLRPLLSMSSATSADRAQMVVWALTATIEATAVPHEPAPSTATRGCLRCIGTPPTWIFVDDRTHEFERQLPSGVNVCQCCPTGTLARACLRDTSLQYSWNQ